MAEPKPSPFFIGEDAALDFLNTVALPFGQPIDWIESGDELVSWLELAKEIPPEVATRVRATFAPRQLDVVALEARLLREHFRSFVALHAGKPIPSEALIELTQVNEILARDHAYRQISAGSDCDNRPGPTGAFRWVRKRHWETPETLLLPIAEAIGNLVCEKDFRYVRQCEASSCPLWFHDTSKSHARRWCSMAVCGNRAKAAAHRNRLKQGGSGARDS